MVFEEVVDLDEEILVMLDVLMRQKERVAKGYNKKVKVKTFAVGDYVWKVILLMDQRDRTIGKWSPNWKGPFQVSQAFTNDAYKVEELVLN